ncbi:uracil-DNA glycosylase [Oceanobacillus sojae]|uniref:uracil-DNA glycosylase n=1 Tax=Oceanobacillus sojae TaxID=582851 RepID=UPI00364078C4
MNIPLKNDWEQVLKQEFQKDYYKHLREFLKKEYSSHTIYPDMYDIFNALHFTDFQKVKVVILGQDPYHGPHQAHGLSFSVQPGVPVPPSLKNMYQELAADVDFKIPSHGYLKAWADQGVLLLNNVLTVRAHQAHSHKNKGWEQFTNQVIYSLNQKDHPVVFLLWGAAAQKKVELIDTDKHYVLKAPHPSPLSAHRGFFGCRHFSKTNAILKQENLTPIDWQLPMNVNPDN